MATNEQSNSEPQATTNHGQIRKDYTSPELVEYGDVAKLTHGSTPATEFMESQ
jgi:hypothetical protein